MLTLDLIATPLYLGLNLLITLALALNVVRHRRNTLTGYGDGEHKSLRKAIRAHGNNIEYMPGAMVLIGTLEIMNVASWIPHAFGVVFTLSRVLHAQGLFSSLKTSLGRFVGTIGAMLVYLVGGIVCLVLALRQMF